MEERRIRVSKAGKEDFDIEIKAVSTGEFTDELKKGWNLVLVAPQVKHRFDSFEEHAKEEGVPIKLILPQGYSPLGGSILLELIKNYL